MADILDGLIYPIEAQDRFTKTFVDFLDGIDSIRKEVDGLTKSTAELQRMGKAFQDIADASNKVKDAQKGVSQRLEAITKAAEARRKEENRAADAIARQKREFQEAEKAAAALAKATREAARNASTVAQAQASNARRQRTEIQRTTQAQREANRALEQHGVTLLQLARTFVLYRVFRDVLLGIRDAFVGGIGFNAEIETATIGIASLLAATGEVRDALGQSVDTATEFELAIGLAADQIEKLRIEALKTPATFRELLEAFQTAIGPGLAAGLDPDQIRKFAVQVSQAARAIGLPQQQLAEEIRSLFQGTITPRATRIATVLGITNEDIRNWELAGTLIQNLQERFNAFSAASRSSERTLAGLWARYTDALQEALRQGLDPVFLRLKETIDAGRKIILLPDNTVNPKIVIALREISAAAIQIIDEFSKFGQSIGSERLVRAISTISEGLATIISFVGSASTSFALAFDTATRLLEVVIDVVDALGSLGGVLPTNVFAQALGIMVGIQAATKITAFLAKQLFQTWSLISGKALVQYVRNLIIANRQEQRGLATVGLYAKAYRSLRVTQAAIAAEMGLLNKVLAASAVLWKGMTTAALALGKAALGVLGAVASLFIIEKLFSLFESFSGDKQVENLNQRLQDTTSILIPATRATEIFSKAWDEVTKSVADARKELQIALAAAAVEGAPARRTASTLAENQVTLAEQLKELDQELLQLQKAKTAELDRAAKVQFELRKSTSGLARDLAGDERLNEALLESLRLRTRIAAVKKQQEQAAEDGTAKEISKVRDLSAELKDLEEQEVRTNAIIAAARRKAEEDAAGLAFIGDLPDQVAVSEARREAAKTFDEYVKRVQEATAADSTALAIQEQQEGILKDQVRLRREIIGVLSAYKIAAEQADRSGEIRKETDDIDRQRAALERVISALESGDEAKLIDAEASNDIEEIRARYSRTLREITSESETLGKALQAAITAGLDGQELDSFKTFVDATQTQLRGLAESVLELEAAEIAERQARAADQIKKSIKETRDTTQEFTRFLNQGVQEANDLRRQIDAIRGVAKREATSFRADIAEQQGNRALAARLRAEGELFDLEMRRAEISRTQEDLLSQIQKREEDIKASKIGTAQQSQLLLGLENERALVAQGISAEYELLEQQLLRQKAIIENLTAREQNPMTTGLFDAGMGLSRGVEERSREFFTTLGTAFAGSISDALFDALDPNNAQEIGDRVLGFLRAVGGSFIRGIIEELAGALFTSIAAAIVPALILEQTAAGKAALARSLSAAALILASETELANAILAAKIRAASGVASAVTGVPFGVLSRASGGPVSGYASGGAVNSLPRPSYIPASDTVPAWLTPGEWIAPVRTVRRYSMEFLEALRKGWIDPVEAQSLLRGRRRTVSRALSSSKIRGYAEGGAASAAIVGPRSAASRKAVAVAVMAPSEQSLEAQLARGDRALREWLRRNKAFIASLT